MRLTDLFVYELMSNALEHSWYICFWYTIENPIEYYIALTDKEVDIWRRNYKGRYVKDFSKERISGPDIRSARITLENIVRNQFDISESFYREFVEGTRFKADLKTVEFAKPEVCLYADICKHLIDLFEHKNVIYGDSFHWSFKEYGLLMSCVGVQGKLNRLKQPSREEPKVKNEVIKETLMDIANYAIMTIIELEKEDNDE